MKDDIFHGLFYGYWRFIIPFIHILGNLVAILMF